MLDLALSAIKGDLQADLVKTIDRDQVVVQIGSVQDIAEVKVTEVELPCE
jgi:hypothetical protein